MMFTKSVLEMREPFSALAVSRDCLVFSFIGVCFLVIGC